MNLISRILLIFFVLSVSLGLNAQNNGNEGYTPDWQIGQHGEQKAENKQTIVNQEANNNYVSDWAIGQQGDPKQQTENNEGQYVSDWQMIDGKNIQVGPTPQEIIDADNLYFDDYFRSQTNVPVKETPIVTSPNGRNSNLMFSLGLNYDTREFYNMDKKDDSGRIIESFKMDKATDVIASKTVYEYAGLGDVFQYVEEYYPNGMINRKYTYKNDKLEGEYRAYSKEGVMIISRNYIDGLLQGHYFMYYSSTGNLHKKILYRNDVKVCSIDYAPDGQTVLKETTYNDKGGVLTTKEPVVDEKGKSLTQYYDYGYKPYSKLVNGNISSLNNTPMALDGKNFMMEGYVIKQIETMTGASAPEGYTGDKLLWYIEKALAFIAEDTGENLELNSDHIDLIFADNMIFGLSHLARKYELAGDRTKAQEIRYDVMLLGTVVYYNLKKFGNITREQCELIKTTYNQLNINYTEFTARDMKKYLEDNNIVPASNQLMLRTIDKYNPMLIRESVRSIKIK